MTDKKLNPLGRIAHYFITNKQMTFLLMLVILVLGVTSVALLPKESLPEIVFPRVTVQTIYPGASAFDVEALITDPIERKLSGLSDLDQLSSSSSAGVSVISLGFNEGVDIQRVELEIKSLLTEVSLPEGASEPSARIFKTSELPVLTFAITGPYQLATLEAIGEDLKSAIERIASVDEVNLIGGVQTEIQVALDPLKLLEAGLSIEDVSNALKARNINFPVGETTVGSINYAIRIEGTFASIDEIETVYIVGRAGQGFFLSDLGTVAITQKSVTRLNRTFFSDATLNEAQDVQESIYGVVTRKKGSDVLGTSDRIRGVIDKGIGVVYPNDVTVSVLYDNATNVNRDLSNIQLSALSGLMVVVLVLFLFIGLKESLIVSITIPLSLLMTLGLLNYLGISLNTFAILGLIVALGLLVDNSIIVMENMDRLYRLGYTPLRAALDGVNEVALPILASTLTTVAAFFPLAILPGIVGEFINTIPRTIILALLSSLVISITVTPSLYAAIMVFQHNRRGNKAVEKPKRQFSFNKIVGLGFVGLISFYAFYDPLMSLLLPLAAVVFFTTLMAMKFFLLKGNALEDSGLVRVYQRLLTYLLLKKRRQLGVLLLGFVVLLGTGAFIPLGILKINFFPQNEPTNVSIVIDTPGGTTLADTLAIVEEVESIIKNDPAIEVFNTAIGGREIDLATIDVTFFPKEVRNESGFDVLARIDRSLKGIPGAQIIVTGSAGGGPPVGKPIVFEFLADDYLKGREVALAYQAVLSQQPGVFNVNLSVKDGAPDLVIQVDKTKAASLGLSVASIANQVRVNLNGVIATTFNDGTAISDVRLVLSESSKDPLLALESIGIFSTQGTRVPLSEVVRLETVQGLSSIQREDGQRIMTLDADILEGFNANEVVSAFEAAIEESGIDLPLGVSLKVAGDQAAIADSFLTLFQSLVLAMLLVFIILTVQFKSMAQPFAILLTVPMALIGVFVGLVLTGNEFGFYAFMGIVSLVGIAVNDAIVLIDYMNGLRKEGKPLLEAIKEAGKTRFNPVLATTMTTIGGVLPLAFREVYYAQFSYALVFGLLVTTLLTLIFIPIIYNLIEGFKLKWVVKGGI